MKRKPTAGHPTLYRVENGLWLPHADTHNQVQATWAFIVAQLLRGRKEYKINAMYLEFENVANPSDVITTPAFDIDEGQEYYESLSSNPDRDFLRVSLTDTPVLTINPGDEAYFTDGLSGNQLTFRCQSSGSVGVHGRTFSAGVNSKVFGIALVATPVFTDRTQDVVYSRAYFEGAAQLVKAASRQIGVGWPIVLHVN